MFMELANVLDDYLATFSSFTVYCKITKGTHLYENFRKVPLNVTTIDMLDTYYNN